MTFTVSWFIWDFLVNVTPWVLGIAAMCSLCYLWLELHSND